MERDIHNLRPDGFAVSEEFQAIYGRINGVNVLLEPYKTENTHYLTFRLDLTNEEKREELLSYLRLMERECSYIAYAGWNNKYMVYVSFHVSEGEDLEHINTLINRITDKCNELGLYNCCENCKGHGDLHFVDMSGDKFQMCSSCFEYWKNRLQNFYGTKENVALGILGGLIGALLGSLLWLILDQVHFIAGIAGYAIVYCSFKGYTKLGKKMSRKGVVLCVVMCALVILFADFFSLSIDIYRAFSDYSITLAHAIYLTPAFLVQRKVLVRALINLGLGYLVAFLGCYPFVKSVWQATKERPQKEIRYI